MNPAFLISILSGEAAAAAQRARRSAIEYLLAGIMAICGFGFLLLAGYIVAARRYGDLTAALGIGAGFLAIAVALLLYHRISAKARARRAKERLSAEAKTVAGTALVTLLPLLLSRRTGLAGMALPVLGALGYAIYRENSKRSADDPDLSD